MFDIGFSELVLVAVIALVVLGPDRLPGALRTLGLWIGRLRRSFNTIKADIEREVGADEIRRQLRNEAIMEKIKNTRTQVTQSLDSVKKEAEAVKKDLSVENEIKSLTGQTATETPPPPPPLKPAGGEAEASGPAAGGGESAASAPASGENPGPATGGGEAGKPADAGQGPAPAPPSPAPDPVHSGTESQKNRSQQ